MPTILVVDDEQVLTALVADHLEREGFCVVEAFDGPAALDLARWCNPDAVVLDLGLPDPDGLEVCRRLRELSDAPVLILADWDAEESKVLALNLGADDVLDKPFSRSELTARVRALLRRPRRAGAPPLST